MKEMNKTSLYPEKNANLRWWYVSNDGRLGTGYIVLDKRVYDILVANSANLMYTRKEKNVHSVVISKWKGRRYIPFTLAELITGYRNVKRGPKGKYHANDFRVQAFRFQDYQLPPKGLKLGKTQNKIPTNQMDIFTLPNKVISRIDDFDLDMSDQPKTLTINIPKGITDITIKLME